MPTIDILGSCRGKACLALTRGKTEIFLPRHHHLENFNRRLWAGDLNPEIIKSVGDRAPGLVNQIPLNGGRVGNRKHIAGNFPEGRREHFPGDGRRARNRDTGGNTASVGGVRVSRANDGFQDGSRGVGEDGGGRESRREGTGTGGC